MEEMKTSKIIASNQDYIDLYNGVSVPIGHNFLSGEIPEHVYPIREEDLPLGMPTRLRAEVISFENGERFLITKEPVVPSSKTLDQMDNEERKQVPLFTGCLAYFPDALIAVAKHSKKGNDQHNPDMPLHWDRSKSGNELDSLTRHLIELAKDPSDIDAATAVAWRALANLQKMVEETQGEKPINFDEKMVRAILANRKTQTRRPIKSEHISDDAFALIDAGDGYWQIAYRGTDGYVHTKNWLVKCPWQVGDILWVREKWGKSGSNRYEYAASPNDGEHYRSVSRWRSSMHMPREASRITLEVTAIRAERVQTISKDDCVLEGTPGVGFKLSYLYANA